MRIATVTSGAGAKAAGAVNGKVARQLWHMMAKRAATGRNASLDANERFHLVVERSDGGAALYLFYSRQDTAGRVAEDVARHLGQARNRALRVSSSSQNRECDAQHDSECNTRPRRAQGFSS